MGATGAIRLAAAGLLLLAACSAGNDAQPAPGSTHLRTVEYQPGVAADVHEPSGPPTAVVVLLPGGAWVTADRAGLTPLAEALADAGFLAVNATYRTAADGVVHPVPVQDVRCAIGFAAAQGRAAGTDGPLVVLGHSAGAHLAAVAALGATEEGPDCQHPTPEVDGLIGLAGVYDNAAFEFALVDLFGTSRAEDTGTWIAADPVLLARAGAGPDLATLLLHGDRDQLVPVTQAEALAAALESSGRAVELQVLPGETHDTIYSADVAGPITTAWIARLVGVEPVPTTS